MFRDGRLALQSIFLQRFAKTVAAALAISLIQISGGGNDQALALSAPVNLTISGDDISSTFGDSAEGVFTTTGGSADPLSYRYSLSPQRYGINMIAIDSSTNRITVDTLTPAGEYQETLTAQDGNGYQSSRVIKISIAHAKRTLALYSLKSTLNPGETATLFPYVDSTTPTIPSSYIGNDGIVSYSAGNSTGCAVDSQSGVVSTAYSGGTCLVTGFVSQGNYYKAASKSISLKIGNASHSIYYFAANDGTAAFQQLQGALSSTFTTPAAPTRNGYTFLGWSENTSGDYLVAANTQLTFDGDKTFYAIWRSNSAPAPQQLNAPKKVSSAHIAASHLSAGSAIVLTVVITDTSSVTGDEMFLPLNDHDGVTLNVNINWGDGDSVTGQNSHGTLHHIYRAPGTYTITITGVVPQFGFDDGSRNDWTGDDQSGGSGLLINSSMAHVTAINSFGELGTTSLRNFFFEAPSNFLNGGFDPVALFPQDFAPPSSRR